MFVTLEDFFGFNNPLLQTDENVKSDYIKETKKYMTDEFKKLMFTAMIKKNESHENENKKSKKNDNKKDKDPRYLHLENIFNKDKSIDREGFIIVVDYTEPQTLEDAKIVIDKLHQIEKTSYLFYPKCIFINKFDRFQDKNKVKSFLSDIERLKFNYKVDVYKVSCLTNTGIMDALKKFLGRVHQSIIDRMPKEDIEIKDYEEVEEEEINFKDKWNFCTRKFFCGSTLFTCGGNDEVTEENEDPNKF